MSTALQRRHFTSQEYLQLEVAADYKSEYDNCRIIPMTRASDAHIAIAANVIAELRAQLKGRACKVGGNDLKIKVADGEGYTYPDATVVCPPSLMESAGDTDYLLNPTVIVEILSESITAFDGGAKFPLYRRIPSLREYLVIAQTHPHIEVYSRGDNGEWCLRDYDGLDAVAPLPSIDCRLASAEVYDKVNFASPQDLATEKHMI